MGSMLRGLFPQTRKHRNHHPTLFDRHPGQAIVLIAVLMIVLVGFTGLAIDGGELYFLQRNAQNAADAAVLEAVYELCQDPNRPQAEITFMAVEAGLASARENGFNNDGVTNWVTITTPDYPPGSTSLSYNFVTVTIRAIKPSRLIQVVYNGPLEVTVQTSANCTQSTRWASGAALFGIGTCSGGGFDAVEYTGAGADITGGPDGQGSISSNGSLQVQNGTVTGTSSANNSASGNATFSPASTENTGVIVPVPEFWTIGMFTPPNGSVYKVANGYGEFYYVADANSLPGNKVNGWNDFPGSGHPKKGIYFVNGNIDMPSSEMGGQNLNGVTIVATGTISLSFGNGAESSLIPYPIEPEDFERAGVPVLPALFTPFGAATCDNSTNNEIFTQGKVSWLGVIYAPRGECAMAFSEGQSLNGSIMCFRVNLSGSGFTITYDPDWIPPIPPILEITS